MLQNDQKYECRVSNAEEKVDLEIIPELISASWNASGIQGDCINLRQKAKNAT